MLPLLVVAWLLWAETVPGPLLNERLFRWAPWEFWCGALITGIGLLFAIWARVEIGHNWSGTVTIKRDHELIFRSPYALVRHPIYTGLILAFIGSAIARGQWRGVFAVFVLWASLWRKLRVEERWMIERFGEKYEAYRQRVPEIVPFTKGPPRQAPMRANPPLKRSLNGRPPGPICACAVHCLRLGPRGLPLSPT